MQLLQPLSPKGAPLKVVTTRSNPRRANPSTPAPFSLQALIQCPHSTHLLGSCFIPSAESSTGSSLSSLGSRGGFSLNFRSLAIFCSSHLRFLGQALQSVRWLVMIISNPVPTIRSNLSLRVLMTIPPVTSWVQEVTGCG